MTELDVRRRDRFGEQVVALLQQDRRVRTVTWCGSIAAGHADCYSDIDLRTELQESTDRAFVEDLPRLLGSLGPLLVVGWGLAALPEIYVRTCYFSSQPLFWRVDIECQSEQHLDGTDLKQQYHWEQIFKIWIDVVKELLRGNDTTPYLEGFMRRWADLTPYLLLPAHEKLAIYLDLCAVRAKSRQAPYETFYQRCHELRQEYLVT